MKKAIQKKSDINEYEKRLVEIAQMQFGSLSDDDILHTLAERKEILLMREHEQERLEKMKKEAEEKALREKKEAEEKAKREEEASQARIRHEKKKVIKQKIEVLNQSISADKKDDELLALIEERRALENEIIAIEKMDVKRDFSEELGTETSEISDNVSSQPVEESPVLSEKEDLLEQEMPEEEKTTLDIPKEQSELLQTAEEIPATNQEPIKDIPPALAKETDDEFGIESIGNHGIEEDSQFARYVDQLNSNTGSLGEFLQQLPIGAKQNKAFMLKVAEIDPAYAMHYADPQTLKTDEDFNVRVAGLDNPRNSGNALAEMLPSARTSQVLLTAVKRDFRNVKFIEPQMADYDEIMTIAKKSALQKIKDLKDSADIDLLLPKILQQDKQFMIEVKALSRK